MKEEYIGIIKIIRFIIRDRVLLNLSLYLTQYLQKNVFTIALYYTCK